MGPLKRQSAVTDTARPRGWTEEDLAKLFGGNFLRVFREVLRPE